jgi:hypothetical protein
MKAILGVSTQNIEFEVMFILLLNFTCLSPPRISQDTSKTNWDLQSDHFEIVFFL